MNTTPPDDLIRLLEVIAQRHLRVPTLKTRGRDSPDFHDIGVGGLCDALEAAYRAGAAYVPRPDAWELNGPLG